MGPPPPNVPSQLSLDDLRTKCGVDGQCIDKIEKEVCVLLHPIHSKDIRRGVTQELEAMLTRYSHQLGGLPLAYENPRLVSSHGWLFDTNPFNHLLVHTTFYVFNPKVGSIVDGVVKRKSPGHLGCLVHGRFNVSVLRTQDAKKQEWCGMQLEEGDQVKLKLVDVKLGYYMPYFKAELDLESVEEAVEARARNTFNTKITFDEDSGISSNEADESLSNHKVKNKKIKFNDSSEEEEEQEKRENKKCKREKKTKQIKKKGQEEVEESEPSENKSKKKKKVKEEICAGTDDNISEEKLRKKLKKKKDKELPVSIKTEMCTDNESTSGRPKKRKRHDEEEQPEESSDEVRHQKKKRKTYAGISAAETSFESPKKSKGRKSIDGNLTPVVANIKEEVKDSSFHMTSNSPPSDRKKRKSLDTLKVPKQRSPKRK
ncbi:hypothetical protein Pmani_033323 [Petrolisthes manimaculis]|uniref:DNA-directed RNA polymerase I subunit RPA43 n=2 Tax=Petrolisthes manimaculis TaxID=1843537 RepID=A0AAE1NPQ2_9EUCA|nr:hypothetical protein Pmani_033323 [Petrolisthes manimaculis]